MATDSVPDAIRGPVNGVRFAGSPPPAGTARTTHGRFKDGAGSVTENVLFEATGTPASIGLSPVVVPPAPKVQIRSTSPEPVVVPETVI